MDLHALTDFNLVAAHGGFSRASRITGRSKATLSHKVTDLERSLGVRLIERGSHALRLTDEGRALHERTAGLLGEIAEVGEAVASGAPSPRGVLRVSAPLVFAQVVLGRFGAEFVRAYPEVQLDIVGEDRLVDPVEDGYDLVIRIDPAPDVRLVGRCFLEDERWVVAPPGLSCPKGRPEQAGGHSVAAVMMPGGPPDPTWQIHRSDGTLTRLRPNGRLFFSSLLMIRDAVLAGAGISLLPMLFVAEDVAAGRLVLWGKRDQPAVQIWALHHSRRLTSAKVRAFIDMLTRTFPDRRMVHPYVDMERSHHR